MNYRTSELLGATDLGQSGTKTIDVNVAEPISRIEIMWKVTRAGEGMDSYPHKDISKIELVDGSDVLFSMDGGQCQALCIYDRRCPTMNHGEHKNANGEVSLYGLDFGRFLHDPLLALDPKRFKNPQLKITYSEIICDTGASVNEMTVWAHLFDEKVISPMGFLMSKAHHAYTPGNENSYEYIDLPTDFPLRKMLIQGYYAGYEPWAQIKEARLSEDTDKRVPFDWDLEKYYRLMKGSWKQIHEEFYGEGDSGGSYSFYVTPTDYKATFIGNVLTGAASCGPNSVCKGGVLVLKTSAATGHVIGYVTGFLPNHCFEFPFGDQKDPADWYDVSKIGSLRLRLKAGSSASSGAGAVILQQLRRY